MQRNIERNWQEREVTVPRERLLATLKENRTKHQAAYKEAVDGYVATARERLHKLRDKATRNLAENFAMVEAKINKFDPHDDEPLGNVIVLLNSMAFELEVPQDHTKDYDVAIQMAEWETASIVKLMQSQFQCFVLDDWEWKHDFENTSKMYVGAARRG